MSQVFSHSNRSVIELLLIKHTIQPSQQQILWVLLSRRPNGCATANDRNDLKITFIISPSHLIVENLIYRKV